MQNPATRVLIAVLAGLLFAVAYIATHKKKLQPSDFLRPQATARMSLTEARLNFRTTLLRRQAEHLPVPPPPPQLFRTVRYDSPAGKLAAYLSQPPKDGQRHPAIVWVVGGWGNGIGGTPWEDASPDNDQSASAFWKAGIVTMYPSFRGGNDNPGYNENFYGEVDDVLAAADYLARQDFVDPNRIYLGGHSTGGTLTLLVAESSSRFRAVFSFGPRADVRDYEDEYLVFDTKNPKEFDLRAPYLWLNSIHNPTFVFEGTSDPSNAGALRFMRRDSTNPKVQFYPVPGFDHFSILAPATRLLVAKILADNGPVTNITFTDAELVRLNFRRGTDPR